MNFALVKDGKCENIAVFDNKEDADNLRSILNVEMVLLGEADKYVSIGDVYEDGNWIKKDKIELPTAEERLTAIEDTLLMLL